MRYQKVSNIVLILQLVLAAIIVLPASARSQSITVSNYDSAAIQAKSKSIPGDSFYKYSYSEVLVPGTYLSSLSNITAIAFEVLGAGGGRMFDSCDIYFGRTSDTVLHQWHYDSTFCRVYSGSLNFDSLGWRQVELDTLYPWDGVGNLVVAVNRINTCWWLHSTFAAHLQPGCARYYVSNSLPCTMANFDNFYSWNVNPLSPVPNYRFIGSPMGVVLGVDTIYADTSAFLNPQCAVVYGAEHKVELHVSGIVGESTLTLMDAQGVVEFSSAKSFAAGETKVVPLNHLASGTYYLHISTANVDLVQKVFIQSPVE